MQSQRIEAKLRFLKWLVTELESVVVAFSGGVDSSFMLRVAHDCLGTRAVGVTALSPSLPTGELEEARAVAACIGAHHEVITTQEVSDPLYVANTPARCYFCKTEVYSQLRAWAESHGFRQVIDGLNMDDLSDRRPGRKAAIEQGVRSPLVEAGLYKSEIRELSRAMGLPNWDKPPMACLSSRIPYGRLITVEDLRQIDEAEMVLRRLGLRQVRVRQQGDSAWLEVDPADLEVVLSHRQEIVAALGHLGYTNVALDLEGYRSGSLNVSPKGRGEEPPP